MKINKIVILFALIVFIIVGCKRRYWGADYRIFRNTPAWKLAKAVRDEDTVKIAKILSNNPQLVNYQDSVYGNTLLMLSVYNKKFDSFKCLINYQADVNIHNNTEGASAMTIACEDGDIMLQYVDLLVKHGANINDYCNGQIIKGNTTIRHTLCSACNIVRNKGVELTRYLLRHGANPNFKDCFGNTPLRSACQIASYITIIDLIEAGADIHDDSVYIDYGYQTYHNITQGLRRRYEEIDSERYFEKMKLIEILKTKGIDYWKEPIPDYIHKMIMREHPDDWEYIESIY